MTTLSDLSDARSSEGQAQTDDDSHASVRAQRAVVRSLTDALAQLTAAGDAAHGVREQLGEEMDRLGYRLQEASAAER